MATMNVSLPDQMKEWVEAQVAKGDYANSSDVIRDLIRRQRERERALAELRTLVDEALESGEDAPLDRARFLKEIRAASRDG